MSVASRQFRTDPCPARESCVVFIVRIKSLLELTRVICVRNEDLRIQFPYCDFGSILFGIVEVLTVVPVSSGETSAPYVDGCWPSGSTSWRREKGKKSTMYRAQKKKERLYLVDPIRYGTREAPIRFSSSDLVKELIRCNSRRKKVNQCEPPNIFCQLGIAPWAPAAGVDIVMRSDSLFW